jgi:hypothetical protein
MKPVRPALFAALLLLGLGAPASVHAQEEDDVANEYRITLFPNYRLKDSVTGFGYLGFVTNPDRQYQLYYLGWPGFIWTPKPNVLQVWTGLFNIYTNNEVKEDKIELRPFVGLKTFVPNGIDWRIYNLTRFEFRITKDFATDEWNEVNRLRSRFGVEFPLASGARAWQKGTFYGLADVEPFYRFDHEEWDPVRVRVGLAYIFHGRCRAEFIYHAQWTRPEGPLEYTDNIFRLNVKIGLTHGILPRVMDADADE